MSQEKKRAVSTVCFSFPSQPAVITKTLCKESGSLASAPYCCAVWQEWLMSFSVRGSNLTAIQNSGSG